MDPAEIAPSIAELASQAGRLALQLKPTVVRELKPDGSVVTAADREVEMLIREGLRDLVGPAPVWGEEMGRSEPDDRGLWLVDPIDGTSNYAAGTPLWGVSIAWVKDGQIGLGVVALPEVGESYVAIRGHGVQINGKPMAPIKPGPLGPSDLVGYSESDSRFGLSIPGRQRCTGAFVVEGAWVAAQRYRGMIGIRERMYDVAACILMVEELGGEVRYADGDPLDMRSLLAGERIARPWILFPADSAFFA